MIRSGGMISDRHAAQIPGRNAVVVVRRVVVLALVPEHPPRHTLDLGTSAPVWSVA
jgi:hypothetical protein